MCVKYPFNIDTRSFWKETIHGQHSQQTYYKIVKYSMPGMFYLHNVFQLVIYRFNNAPFLINIISNKVISALLI